MMINLAKKQNLFRNYRNLHNHGNLSRGRNFVCENWHIGVYFRDKLISSYLKAFDSCTERLENTWIIFKPYI